ncbi:hypothetical protein K470DRAFT_293119 [Piedraia hortae CBS 480.64]|uniref:ZZ-type domain-containing protein n=1 Tax=Piedraia hortae CBS 480.64 TaxID=1314780 RepID=A0A6A7C5R3_9PEZI|nr:hypothetical protein K470DRAFT_293119 [Piedraia hortae CBS 480.64]
MMPGPSAQLSMDTPITVKVAVNGHLEKLLIPLRDLGAEELINKLRFLLGIEPHQNAIFERYSDSVGGFITLDPTNADAFKSLFRAAKSKMRLRLRATVTPPANDLGLIKRNALMNPTSSSVGGQLISDLTHRSMGRGVFEFRDARQQQIANTASNARNTSPVNDNQQEVKLVAAEALDADRTDNDKDFVDALDKSWVVCCNECDKRLNDVHYHCSICDDGDYDLCEDCVDDGKMCHGSSHWLIKRYIRDGKVYSSSVERLPGRIKEKNVILSAEPSRTCNNCIGVHPEREFVTCTTCDDFDLCIDCHLKNQHGHHPGHGFKPATPATDLSSVATWMLGPNRNKCHSSTLCDGCDKTVRGVRHKCLDCPDWDFCDECIGKAKDLHPGHRFVPIYIPLDTRPSNYVRHFGIYCDGPLCTKKKKGQWYITGPRYKCAICHDTDFCASCEALPNNKHNPTHPMVMFKSPVRNVNITTENEDKRGNVRVLGDGLGHAPATAASEAKPSQPQQAPVKAKKPVEDNTLQDVDIAKFTPAPQLVLRPSLASQRQVLNEVSHAARKLTSDTPLNSYFVSEAIADGTEFAPRIRFTQTWTVANQGPIAWPAGCFVRFLGGDNMLNIGAPPFTADILQASKSNVINRSVQVGEIVTFSVTLQAPPRLGKSISYWQVRTPSDVSFGCRLWCEINVKEPELKATSAANMSSPPSTSSTTNTSNATRKGPTEDHIPAFWRPGYNTHCPPRPLNAQKHMNAPFWCKRPSAAPVLRPSSSVPRASLPRLINMGQPAKFHDAPTSKAAADNARVIAPFPFVRPQQVQRAMDADQDTTRDAKATGDAALTEAEASAKALPSMRVGSDAFHEGRKHTYARLRDLVRDPAVYAALAKKDLNASPDRTVKHNEVKNETKDEVKSKKKVNDVKSEEQAKVKDGDEPKDENKVIDQAEAEAENNVNDQEVEPKTEMEKTKPKEAETKAEDVKPAIDRVVFPTLDKESPASSMQLKSAPPAYVTDEDGKVESTAEATSASAVNVGETIDSDAAAAPSTSSESNDDSGEEGDIEVLSAAEESDDFDTDEEYEILDACDSDISSQ